MDAEQTIGRLFPYDGPHTPERVGDAAIAVEQLLRYLANATRRPIATGPDLARVLGGLSSAVNMLPQTLRQLDNAAARLSEDPTVFDRGGRGRDTAVAAAVACEDAAPAAHDLAELLNHAFQLASRLGHREVQP